MYSAKLDPQGKDYCAHKLIDLYACYRTRFPFVTTCKHERHEYDACVYDDYIIRYKEYEREKRLKAREERIAKKRRSEQMDEPMFRLSEGDSVAVQLTSLIPHG